MKVVVVGGGFAGLAAAIALQERRHDVVLLERRGVLGGRATSLRDAVTGEDVDNGTHLMLGAYGATLDLLRRAGALDLVALQPGLKLEWRDEKGATALECPPLGAPLHLVAGILGLRVPLAVKLQAIRLGLAVRFGKRPTGLTLAEYFRRCGQGPSVRRLLWDPLALAILNEPVERAAAVLFHRVFEEAFLRDNRASRLALLRRGWGVLFERLARYLEGRGGTVRRGARVDEILVEGAQATGVRYTQRAGTREEVAGRREGAAGRREEAAGRAPSTRVEAADAVVSAVPAHALRGLLPGEWRTREPFAALERFSSSPIVSIEIWLDRVVVDRPMLGLRDSEVEWVFDKGRLHGREGAPQHLAFVVSAAYRSAPKPNAELVAAATGALGRCFPAMATAHVQRALVLREPLATFASSPELEPLRPEPDTPIPGLFLAGDWTNTGLPATIEGAVRSGQRAAQHARAYLMTRASSPSSSAPGAGPSLTSRWWPASSSC
jgi:squalene-associated FAD-dependent desaturase